MVPWERMVVRVLFSSQDWTWRHLDRRVSFEHFSFVYRGPMGIVISPHPLPCRFVHLFIGDLLRLWQRGLHILGMGQVLERSEVSKKYFEDRIRWIFNPFPASDILASLKLSAITFSCFHFWFVLLKKFQLWRLVYWWIPFFRDKHLYSFWRRILRALLSERLILRILEVVPTGFSSVRFTRHFRFHLNCFYFAIPRNLNWRAVVFEFCLEVGYVHIRHPGFVCPDLNYSHSILGFDIKYELFTS